MATTRTHLSRYAVLLSLALMVGLSACDEKPSAGAKPGPSTDAKVADAKVADAKVDDTKVDDAKVDDTKVDDTKVDDGKGETGGAGNESDGGGSDDGNTAPDDPAVLPASAGAPGPAYFAVRERGLVQLDGGMFTVVENSPTTLLRDMHVETDGKLYLLGVGGILRVEGTKAVSVAETSFKTTGSVDAFALANDHKTLWAVGFKGISRWDGAQWSTEDKAVLGEGITLLKGVVVDRSDRVWVMSSNHLHTREGDTWVDVDTSKVFESKPFFDMLRRGPKGEALALASSQLLQLDAPGALTEIDLAIKGFASLGYLSVSSNGTMALRSGIDEVMRVDPRQTWKAGKDFVADHIRGVGVDGRGRVWVASDIGVTILGPGEAKTQWNSGTFLELAGQVEQIVVIGSGPKLPAAGEAKTGGIKGEVLSAGKALPDAEVEVCPSPDMMFDVSPCDDSPVKMSSKTDSEGQFSFADVPIGAYGVAVKVDGKWQLTRSPTLGMKMKEGAVFDVGAIHVKSD